MKEMVSANLATNIVFFRTGSSDQKASRVFCDPPAPRPCACTTVHTCSLDFVVFFFSELFENQRETPGIIRCGAVSTLFDFVEGAHRTPHAVRYSVVAAKDVVGAEIICLLWLVLIFCINTSQTKSALIEHPKRRPRLDRKMKKQRLVSAAPCWIKRGSPPFGGPPRK